MPHGNPRAGDRAFADPNPLLPLVTQRTHTENDPGCILLSVSSVFCELPPPANLRRAFSRVVCYTTVDMPNFLGPARLSSYTRSPSSLSSCPGPPGLAVSLKHRNWNSFHRRYRPGARWGRVGIFRNDIISRHPASDALSAQWKVSVPLMLGKGTTTRCDARSYLLSRVPPPHVHGQVEVRALSPASYLWYLRPTACI
jgi:hypothetical protein